MLRFHPTQFKEFPKRPWPFFKKPYVMLHTPKVVAFLNQGKLVQPRHPTMWWYHTTKNGIKDFKAATRVSAEQAGYLAERGYITVCVDSLSDKSRPPFKFIDVCRLPSSPLRLHPGRKEPEFRSNVHYSNSGPHMRPEKTEIVRMTWWQILKCHILGMEMPVEPLDITPAQKIALITDAINAAQAKSDLVKYDEVSKHWNPNK